MVCFVLYVDCPGKPRLSGLKYMINDETVPIDYFFRCEIRRTNDLIWYRNFFPKNEYKIGFITGLNQGKVLTIFSIFPQIISENEKSFNEN